MLHFRHGKIIFSRFLIIMRLKYKPYLWRFWVGWRVGNFYNDACYYADCPTIVIHFSDGHYQKTWCMQHGVQLHAALGPSFIFTEWAASSGFNYLSSYTFGIFIYLFHLSVWNAVKWLNSRSFRVGELLLVRFYHLFYTFALVFHFWRLFDTRGIKRLYFKLLFFARRGGSAWRPWIFYLPFWEHFINLKNV